MKVLITSSRMPFALGMVRKLAAEGREIYAADGMARNRPQYQHHPPPPSGKKDHGPHHHP
jgi:hypothetical protein